MASIYSITEIGKKIIAIRVGICNIATLNKHPLIDFSLMSIARMAELVDAPDSKSGIGNNVQVRFLFRAR